MTPASTNPKLTDDAAAKARAAGGEAMRAMREGLVRLSEDVHALSYRLHPSIIEDLGLIEALEAECQRFSELGSARIEVKAQKICEEPPRDVALCLFRVAQEALQNTGRHAEASTVRVTIRPLNGGLQLGVHDDGKGFDPGRHRDRPSLGLASMRQRIDLLDGSLDIESAPGHGTTVLAWVPLKEGYCESSARAVG
jgi:signal transduction histidine kinase